MYAKDFQSWSFWALLKYLKVEDYLSCRAAYKKSPKVRILPFSCFLLQNTEILRALQKASGLSPDAEPIKLLSVPKGALGIKNRKCSFVVVFLKKRHKSSVNVVLNLVSQSLEQICYLFWCNTKMLRLITIKCFLCSLQLIHSCSAWGCRITPAAGDRSWPNPSAGWLWQSSTISYSAFTKTKRKGHSDDWCVCMCFVVGCSRWEKVWLVHHPGVHRSSTRYTFPTLIRYSFTYSFIYVWFNLFNFYLIL